MLADSFVKVYAVAIKVATRKSDILKIKQKENGMMREFMSRFQMEWMELPPLFDDWAEPKQNKERYQPYLEERRNAPRRNPPRNDWRVDQGHDPQGFINKARIDRNVVPTGAPHLSEYNFNVDVSNIVFAISEIRDAKWPKPMLSDPSQRNYNLVCEFHNSHIHRTEDCHQLREEVARLLDKGHLREFLSD
uniref:Uncharacterized protein LOC104233927 n=1 Tax=Nicotiana sylvestris TaxID=4096 RepID=A0A1U7XGV3_NICSY|nr:PREDICTED: uncharacterized protein LOC104233927 [Nicotiana sylvestris]